MRKAMLKAIDEAVRREGSRTRVAKNLGISRQAIQHWDTKEGGHRVPPKHVLGLEAMSGVSRYELRPDIYGPSPVDMRRTRGSARPTSRAAA